MTKANIHLTLFLLFMVMQWVGLTYCGSKNQKQSQQFADNLSCEQSMQMLMKHSGWKSPFKNNFEAEVENAEGNILRVQLSAVNNDGHSNTIGWIMIDEQKKTLCDITNDLENPESITYQTADWDRFMSCYHNKAGSSPATSPVLQLSDLFSEGSTTSFSPKDFNKNDPFIKQFKANLTRFEEKHAGKRLNVEDLSILINYEAFDNSKTYVNSSWLNYFLTKYPISPVNFNAIFDQAINQEDYPAVKIMLQHSFIVSDQQLKVARQAKENSVRLTRYNLENKGLDDSGDPTFYDHKKSTIDAIQQLLNAQYRANAIHDSDGFTNLRESKSKTSGIIEQIKNAEYIKVLDNTGEWWQVETGSGHKGYVFWTRIKSGTVNR